MGLALAFLGGLWLISASGLVPDTLATVIVAAVSFGVAALWDRSESQSLMRVILPGSGGGVSVFRLLAGLGLVVGGLGLLFTSVEGTTGLGVTFLAVAVTLAGFALAFGPWMTRMANDLSRERRERVRSEERSEVAAHLHDSVLQTLALIQRTEDPRSMASLARTQERELRSWLYGRAPIDGADLLSTALETAAARVEDERHVTVDFVKVGDATLDDRGRALMAATTEAMVNSAKHSGTGKLSVYLEVNGTAGEVWVTDQGNGFDKNEVTADRKGIEESIVGRMIRYGGTAEVDSRPGEGTEVHLTMPGIRTKGARP
jgi:signal transduction histidine kinase